MTRDAGRDCEMSELWARTHVGGEGVVIVSEMPNGRTSLLQRLARKFKLSGRKTLLIDLLRLPINASAGEIWSKIHRRTGINFVEDTLVPLHDQAPVLLMDDFHLLLERPGLIGPEFLGNLRASVQGGALLFVAASRLDLLTLDQRLSGDHFGSPYLNNLREYRLGPLCRRDADNVLVDIGADLSPADHACVLVCTDAQPKLLRLLTAELLKAKQRDPGAAPRERWLAALRAARPEFGRVLGSLWGLLPAGERRCLVRLALAARAGLELSELECVDAVSSEGTSSEGMTTMERIRQLLRCLQRFQRDVLRQALVETLPPTVLMSLPPESSPDLNFYLEVADFLRRTFEVSRVLRALIRLDPTSSSELQRVLSLWEAPPSGSPTPAELALERLFERQLVQPAPSAPGWQIRPRLLQWWILDQARDAHWLAAIAPCEGERVVASRRALFEKGCHPLVLEVLPCA